MLGGRARLEVLQMLALVLRLLISTFVFAVAIAFVTRQSSDVKVEPRRQLPLVALVITALNVVAFQLIKGLVNLFSFYLLFFVAPFIASAVILWLADKVLKPFRIDSFTGLFVASFVMTLAHWLLQATFRFLF
jgi:uncharacterized membrane protein YvlD (DUF360 family)